VDEFAYYLVAGLCLGAMYGLIALGYTLVYGIIKLINFAHGEIFMVGAYAGFGAYVVVGEHLPGWLSVACVLGAAAIAATIAAGLIEFIAYRPLRRAGRLAALLTAIGMSFLLQELANFIRGGNPQVFFGPAAELAAASVAIGPSGVKWLEVAYLPASIVLTGLLMWMVHRTRFGRAMRAVSQDHTAAVLMGIPTGRVIRRTFMVGGFLAGIAGGLWGLTYNVRPTMGFLPGLNAFVAAVVGGIGSVPGAVVGGFLIGVLQYMVVYFGVPSDYKDVASFVVLILVLLVRPQGLLGREEIMKV
jgi:branched-chain amino acid transport system permease protein